MAVAGVAHAGGRLDREKALAGDGDIIGAPVCSILPWLVSRITPASLTKLTRLRAGLAFGGPHHA